MAPRGNNVIPNAHYHKHWQMRIKTWFNQPARKFRRRQARIAKAKAIAPRPAAGLLRPSVRCPSIRYNTKSRLGRGFTLEELKGAGLPKNFARSIGIAIDTRRTNRSVESLQKNIQRLKEYRSKLLIMPKVSSKPKKEENTLSEIQPYTNKQLRGTILPLKKRTRRYKVVSISDKLKNFDVYCHLRRVRSEKRFKGKKDKKLADAAQDGLGVSGR